eukprot:CAMPEP_0194281462 /NCGR_PEP_ID=MMETSP0169-20130528/20766_1 /TAXON_ID=218684 /ORGANISM="Corethron pennatum, Strain L29A3" /LENGTH=509 /DNA_ID=CAMNT_0039026525 /DNA_START=340 /DNA_END=1869 /DNA_ORIENTATION=-
MMKEKPNKIAAQRLDSISILARAVDADVSDVFSPQIAAMLASAPALMPQQLVSIRTPLPHDVLCGRGGGTNNHSGNERFRTLVNDNKRAYLQSSKREKPEVSRKIVAEIRSLNPSGRFLQKNNTSGLWDDIGDQKAREKTSQALREGAPTIRTKIMVELGKADLPVNAVMSGAVTKGRRKRVVPPSKPVGEPNAKKPSSKRQPRPEASSNPKATNTARSSSFATTAEFTAAPGGIKKGKIQSGPLPLSQVVEIADLPGKSGLGKGPGTNLHLKSTAQYKIAVRNAGQQSNMPDPAVLDDWTTTNFQTNRFISQTSVSNFFSLVPPSQLEESAIYQEAGLLGIPAAKFEEQLRDASPDQQVPFTQPATTTADSLRNNLGGPIGGSIGIPRGLSRYNSLALPEIISGVGVRSTSFSGIFSDDDLSESNESYKVCSGLSRLPHLENHIGISGQSPNQSDGLRPGLPAEGAGVLHSISDGRTPHLVSSETVSDKIEDAKKLMPAPAPPAPSEV